MKKIIIIGGGPAGLTAAYELLRDSKDTYQITVLEESGVLGGISQTVRSKGNRMDIGGHRFFSKDDVIMQWWADLMPLQGKPAYDDRILDREKPLAQGGPDPETDDQVMLVRDRVSRIYYNHCFFDYPVTMKKETIQNMGFLTTMRAGMSYLGACIHKRPETNLENFYINRFGTVLYRMFFEGYTEKLWGRHPSEISADWGAQRVKGLSIRAVLKDMLAKMSGKKNNDNAETSLIEQFWYPKYGPGQLWELVGDKIVALGGTICYHHRVQTVETQAGRITGVICDTPQGTKRFEGDIVISSMPIQDLIASMGHTVPQPIQTIAAGLPYRDFITVGLLVDKLALVNQTQKKTLGNIVPDCWIYVQDKGVKLGRIQIFNNWSPYMVQRPEDTVWIGLEYFCNEGDAFWNMSEDDCIAFAQQELIQMGVIRAGAVQHAHLERVKKAYPAYFDTYAQFDQVVAYLDTFQNLFCIGRNGQHRYNNMDHSMLTAMRAAQAIRKGSTDKRAVWNVNQEKEYHEQKHT